MSVPVLVLLGVLTTCLCALFLLITLYEFQKIGDDADRAEPQPS